MGYFAYRFKMVDGFRMELDPELFRRIAGNITLHLPADDPCERRRAGRVWLGRHTRVRRGAEPVSPDDHANCTGVVIRDVSPGGVAILSTAAVPVGERFVLVLPLASADEPGNDAPRWATAEYQALRCEADTFGAGTFVVAGTLIRVAA
jgi:hypothetical protein